MQFGGAFGFEALDGDAGRIEEQFLSLIKPIALKNQLGLGAALHATGDNRAKNRRAGNSKACPSRKKQQTPGSFDLMALL